MRQPLSDALIARCETNAAGEFRLSAARRSRCFLLARDAEGRTARIEVLVPQRGDPDPVVIRLRDGSPFGGIVFGPRGAPHEGASVHIATEGGRSARSTVTNAAGRFAFGHVGPGKYVVRISAVGFPVIRRTVRIPELGELKATLFEGGTVRGRLRDELGIAIGGATITLTSGDERKSPSGPATAVTQPDGSFRMPDVMPGPCIHATIRIPGWSPRHSLLDHFALPLAHVVAGEELPWNITVHQGAEVAIHVIAEESGEPVPEAMLFAPPWQSTDPPVRDYPRGRTDEHGRLTLRHVPPGMHQLVLAAQGRVQSENRERGAIADTLVVEGRETVRVTIRTVRAAVVEGRALLGDAHPANASVGAGFTRVHETALDHNGYFRFRALPALTGAVVEVRSAHLRSDPFDLKPGDRIWVDVRNPVPPLVEGRVTDERGRPVKGAVVTARPTEVVDAQRFVLPDPGDSRFPRTDADGRFSIHAFHIREDLAKSRPWTVMVAHRDYRPDRRDKLRPPRPEQPHSLTFVLRRGTTISGRVRFEDGQVAGNIPVEAEPSAADAAFHLTRRAMTNAAGEFTIKGVDDGAWSLRAIHGEGRSTPITAHGGADGVKLTIVMHPPIAGVVLDDEGRPIAGAHVRLHQDADPDLITRTASNGRFRLEHVRPGAHRLTISPRQQVADGRPIGAPHFAPIYTKPIAAGTVDVVLRTKVGAILRGRVIDSKGNPVPRAKVVVARHSLWLLVADDRGEFEFKWEGNQILSLLVAADGKPIMARDVAHGAERVTIRLPAGGTLRGRVQDADGRPVAGATVRATADNQSATIRAYWNVNILDGAMRNAMGLDARAFATTGKDGRFRIRGAEAGTYELSVEGGDRGSAKATAHTDGPEVELTLVPADQRASLPEPLGTSGSDGGARGRPRSEDAVASAPAGTRHRRCGRWRPCASRQTERDDRRVACGTSRRIRDSDRRSRSRWRSTRKRCPGDRRRPPANDRACKCPAASRPPRPPSLEFKQRPSKREPHG